MFICVFMTYTLHVQRVLLDKIKGIFHSPRNITKQAFFVINLISSP